TDLFKNHPDWILKDGSPTQDNFLANFGLQEVRDYFLNYVRDLMQLPGFSVYRQDFNMGPLACWRNTDTPDRQGITEIKYIEGLYAYWEAIAAIKRDVLMEECASGGHRVDLETVIHMQMHQKSDFWFNNEV